LASATALTLDILLQLWHWLSLASAVFRLQPARARCFASSQLPTASSQRTRASSPAPALALAGCGAFLLWIRAPELEIILAVNNKRAYLFEETDFAASE
jgi:hypothetical protein